MCFSVNISYHLIAHKCFDSIDILQKCDLDNMILTSQVGVFGTNSPNQIKMPSTKNLDRQAKSRNDKSMSMS